MIDLHIHTNLSADGLLSVEETLAKAEKSKLKTIAITDHNTCIADVVAKHINARKYFSGEIVSGIEIDVCYKGITFELLGYDFNPYPVMNWAEKKFGDLTFRQTKIRNKLVDLCVKKGFKIDRDFPWVATQEYAHSNVFNNLMQYPENVTKFNEKIETFSDFYRQTTTNPNFILYLNMGFLWAKVEDVIKIIRDNGGKVFLAHPFGYSKQFDTQKVLNICKEYGVDGVEVFHTKHTPENEKFLLKWCKENNLLVSGGSDSHGDRDFAQIKSNKITWIK